MNNTFSRTQFPPGGWIFNQPQIGWSNPTPISTTFDSTVTLIIKARQKNPAMCIRHNLSTDPTTVGNELEAFTRLRLGIPSATPPAPLAILPALGGVGVEDIKKIAAGAAILIDWDKSGQPAVTSVLADSRALICLACPKNDVSKLENWRKVPVAGALQSRIARVTAMHLKTPSDQRLGLCEATFAPTAQLVHAPLAIVTGRFKNKASLDSKCWVLSERAP